MVSMVLGMWSVTWSVWFLVCGQSRGRYGSWYVL